MSIGRTVGFSASLYYHQVSALMRNALFEELIERDQLREVAEEAMNASLGTTMFGMVCTKAGREIAHHLRS